MLNTVDAMNAASSRPTITVPDSAPLVTPKASPAAKSLADHPLVTNAPSISQTPLPASAKSQSPSGRAWLKETNAAHGPASVIQDKPAANIYSTITNDSVDSSLEHPAYDSVGRVNQYYPSYEVSPSVAEQESRTASSPNPVKASLPTDNGPSTVLRLWEQASEIRFYDPPNSGSEKDIEAQIPVTAGASFEASISLRYQSVHGDAKPAFQLHPQDIMTAQPASITRGIPIEPAATFQSVSVDLNGLDPAIEVASTASNVVDIRLSGVSFSFDSTKRDIIIDNRPRSSQTVVLDPGSSNMAPTTDGLTWLTASTLPSASASPASSSTIISTETASLSLSPTASTSTSYPTQKTSSSSTVFTSASRSNAFTLLRRRRGQSYILAETLDSRFFPGCVISILATLLYL